MHNFTNNLYEPIWQIPLRVRASGQPKICISPCLCVVPYALYLFFISQAAAYRAATVLKIEVLSNHQCRNAVSESQLVWLAPCIMSGFHRSNTQGEKKLCKITDEKKSAPTSEKKASAYKFPRKKKNITKPNSECPRQLQHSVHPSTFVHVHPPQT